MGMEINTIESHLTFVNGWLTGGTDPGDGSVECGDGTGCPLKVKITELSEMFFGVQDARFDAGLAHSVTFPWATGEFYFTANDPEVSYFSQLDFDVGLGTEHSIIIQRSRVDLDSVNLTEEFQIWDEDTLTPSFPMSGGSWTFENGFTHYAQLVAVNSLSSVPGYYTPYGYLVGLTNVYPAIIELGFTGRVGVVNTPADGNFDPFHPGNELWVEMRFMSYYHDGIAVDVQAYSSEVESGGALISGIELSFVMACGTPTCKLYGASGYPHGGSGYKLRATKWWPYAKGSPSTPFWDNNTGQQL